MTKPRSSQLVVVSDTHCGSRVGLQPPQVELDDGNVVGQNSLQKLMWGHWEYFWDCVHSQAKRRETVVVFNGDLIDGPAHHGTTQQITADSLAQVNIAAELFSPIASKYPVYVTRGTPAHVLASGSADEQVAREIGAKQPSGERKTRSSYHLKLDFNGVLFDFAHHGPGPGNRVWTYGSQLRGYAKTIILDALIQHQKPPDVIVRSHVHHRVWETVRDYGHACEALISPAWQLKTDFAHKVVSHEDVADVGGIVISIDGGKISNIDFKLLPVIQSDRVTIV